MAAALRELAKNCLNHYRERYRSVKTHLPFTNATKAAEGDAGRWDTCKGQQQNAGARLRMPRRH